MAMHQYMTAWTAGSGVAWIWSRWRELDETEHSTDGSLGHVFDDDTSL